MVLRIETDPADATSDCGLLEGRAIQHAKYVSTVAYRRHQEERSDPFTQDTDAGPFIALALEELVNYFPDDARILCVGPREGTEMEMLRDLGHEDLIGVDISIPAARWLSSVGFQSAAMDMHEMAFAPESFDVVLSRHSLEHAHSPERALREMAALLKSGGTLCVIVPRETPDKLDTHHGHPFSDLAELVEMIEAIPGVNCVATSDRRLNNQWNPEIWAVAVKGEAGPLPELRDRVFTQVWDPMVVPAGVRDGATEAIFTIYRKELRRRLQILRPSVLEILAEPGPSSTVILQMGEEAWRVPMAELPVWEKEVAGSFDAVLAAGTLAASADPFAFTRFLENILSPQGILAVVEPGFHPAGEGKDASRGIRPTEEGLAFCFPGFGRIGLETFGPEGSPFAVAGVWSKDGGQEEFPEIDTALRISLRAGSRSRNRALWQAPAHFGGLRSGFFSAGWGRSSGGTSCSFHRPGGRPA